jgi:hypothetical protein
LVLFPIHRRRYSRSDMPFIPASLRSGEAGTARTRGEYLLDMDKAIMQVPPAEPSEWRSRTISAHLKSARTRPCTQSQTTARNKIEPIEVLVVVEQSIILLIFEEPCQGYRGKRIHIYPTYPLGNSYSFWHNIVIRQTSNGIGLCQFHLLILHP